MEIIFSIFDVFKRKKKYHKEADQNIKQHCDPLLDELWTNIQKKYPLKKYIIKENISDQLAPHSELIHYNIQSPRDYSRMLYSYITFHQIFFHLKNYLLKLKKRNHGYRHEFNDIFQDIFLDNFLIIKELTEELKDSYSDYLNIWLDGFFLSFLHRIEDDSIKKYHRIQPQLFFLIILFLSLPKVSSKFKKIPFTSVIKFRESTEKDWNEALNIIKDIEFQRPISSSSIDKIKQFFYIFFHINLSITKKGRMYFEEDSILKAVDFINLLKARSPEMIRNIKKIRNNLTKIKSNT